MRALVLRTKPDTAKTEKTLSMRSLLGLSGQAYHLAVRVLGTPEGAEDVVQQAYLNATRHLSHRPPPEESRAWFLHTVANAAKVHARGETRRRRREASVQHETIVCPEREDERMPQLRSALEALDEKYRVPLALCCEQGLSQREAAVVLEMPERTVSDHVRIGLAKLRKALERAGYPAAVAAVLGGLKQTAPSVPASLAGRVEALVSSGAKAAPRKFASRAVRKRSAVKGGYTMKVIAGILLAGAIATGVAVSSLGGRGLGHPAASPPGAKLPAGPKGMPGHRTEWLAFQPTTLTEPVLDGPAHLATGAGWNGGGPAGRSDLAPYTGDERSPAVLFYGSGPYRMVAQKGEARILTGCGLPGYRDGPAGQAMPVFGGGYSQRGGDAIILREDGSFTYYCKSEVRLGRDRFHAIQKVYRAEDGHWYVKTIAGRGKKMLTREGESAPLAEFDIGPWGGMTADSKGNILVVTRSGMVRFQDEAKATLICSMESARKAYTAAGGSGDLKHFRMQGYLSTDAAGNTYAMGRSSMPAVWRVSPDGKYTPLVGYAGDVKLVDEHPSKVTFHCPMTSFVGPDGAVYVEDEGAGMRRYKDGQMRSLGKDCKWFQFKGSGDKKKLIWKTSSGRSELNAMDRDGSWYQSRDYGAIYRFVKQ